MLGRVRRPMPRGVRGRMPGLVRVPPPCMVPSLPSWLVSPAVHKEEDQPDEYKEDNQKYPRVGDGTGDPQATADGDAGHHCLAPTEYLNVVRPTLSRYIVNIGRSTDRGALYAVLS